MKARDVAIGAKFTSPNMCGPNHTFQRVVNDDPNDQNEVIALNLNWGGRYLFQGGVDIILVDEKVA